MNFNQSMGETLMSFILKGILFFFLFNGLIPSAFLYPDVRTESKGIKISLDNMGPAFYASQDDFASFQPIVLENEWLPASAPSQALLSGAPVLSLASVFERENQDKYIEELSSKSRIFISGVETDKDQILKESKKKFGMELKLTDLLANKDMKFDLKLTDNSVKAVKKYIVQDNTKSSAQKIKANQSLAKSIRETYQDHNNEAQKIVRKNIDTKISQNKNETSEVRFVASSAVNTNSNNTESQNKIENPQEIVTQIKFNETPNEPQSLVSEAIITDDDIEGSTEGGQARFASYDGLHINGSLVLDGDVPVIGSNYKLIVYRENENAEILDEGEARVSQDESSFSITLSDLTDSYLVVEMLNDQDQIVARGENLVYPEFGTEPEHSIIRLSNFDGGLYGVVTRALQYNKTHAVAGDVTVSYDSGLSMYNTDEVGNFKDLDFASGSEIWARFSNDENFKETITLLKSSQKSSISLIEKQFMASIRELLGYENKIPRNYPVIFGQIKNNANTFSGANISVENDPDAQVVYFNDLNIPDKSMYQTGENGYFAVFGIQEGLKVLDIRADGQNILQVLPAQNATVTYLNLDLHKNLKTEVSVASFFEGDDQDFNIKSFESSQVIKLNGANQINYSSTGSLSIYDVEVNAADVPEMSVQLLNRSSRQEFFTVSEDFINHMYSFVKESLGVDYIDDRGHILGYVKSETKIDVLMKEVFEDEGQVLVYFNKDKQVSLEPFSDLVQGYAILNAVDGLQAIRIRREEYEDDIYHQSVYVEPSRLTMLPLYLFRRLEE